MRKNDGVRAHRGPSAWAVGVLGLSLVMGLGLRVAYSQDTPAPADALLSDTWQGDKLDPKWNVTLLGNAQEQEFSLTVNNGLMMIDVGGSDIWNNGDNGVFIWQPANGDFDVILQMNSITRSNDSVKLGIMVRESLSKFSPNVFAMSMPRGGSMQSRMPDAIIGASDSGVGPGGVASGCPGDCVQWGNNDGDVSAFQVIQMRLQRRGDMFTASRSDDGGKTWGPLHIELTEKDSYEVPLPDDVLVGIAMTGHSTAVTDQGIVGPIQFKQVATRPTNNGLVTITATDDGGTPVPDVGIEVLKGDEQLGTTFNEDVYLGSNTASFFLPPGTYAARAVEDDFYAAGAPVPFELTTGKVEHLKVKAGTAK